MLSKFTHLLLAMAVFMPGLLYAEDDDVLPKFIFNPEQWRIKNDAMGSSIATHQNIHSCNVSFADDGDLAEGWTSTHSDKEFNGRGPTPLTEPVQSSVPRPFSLRIPRASGHPGIREAAPGCIPAATPRSARVPPRGL